MLDINRHRMKSLYQRNMLIGMLVATIVFVVPVWVLSSFSTAPESAPHTTVTNIKAEQSAKTPSSAPPTKRNVGGRAQADNGFHGQWLEPGQLKIVPDNPIAPTPAKVPPKVYALETTPVEIDGDFSVSDMDTGTVGAYVPDDAEYVFEPAADDSSSDTLSTPVTRGPELVYSVKARVPPSAEMMGKGDSVKVLLLIGPDGRHANFAVHEEDSEQTSPEFYLDVIGKDGTHQALEFYVDPVKNELLYVTLRNGDPEFKFAEYFYKVLPRWRFLPAIRNGVPVYCFVHITYRFCAPDDVDCVEISLST
ncbi:MAG: hypothetical protein P1R58_06280 [bacterium]|nr:hypothetical protein [bacterium]